VSVQTTYRGATPFTPAPVETGVERRLTSLKSRPKKGEGAADHDTARPYPAPAQRHLPRRNWDAKGTLSRGKKEARGYPSPRRGRGCRREVGHTPHPLSRLPLWHSAIFSNGGARCVNQTRQTGVLAAITAGRVRQPGATIPPRLALRITCSDATCQPRFTGTGKAPLTCKVFTCSGVRTPRCARASCCCGWRLRG
jgi:hypothetical protein